MTYKELIRKLQSELNSEMGEKLVEDGILGPKTTAALEKYDIVDLDFSKEVPDPPTLPPQPKPGGQPPWVAQMLSRLGWTEFSHDKQIAADWHIVGLPQYKTVIGTRHAWCGLAVAKGLNVSGLPIPNGAAGAKNWENYGESCDYICGAILPIRHASGGRHVGVFMYWIDEKKKIAAVLGGNQSNKYSIATTNISGNSHGRDEVKTGPRWPKGYAQTGYVYPHGGAVDGEGGTTR